MPHKNKRFFQDCQKLKMCYLFFPDENYPDIP